MKTFIAALLALVLAKATWAQPAPGETSANRLPVTAAALYLDSIFTGTLAQLQLIASTPEAQAGDWPGIKRYLEQLALQRPGAYFYVLPDGDYYTHTRDLTHLNLSDRPYFPSLFAGNPVLGFPIYSRSSGQKSALVAAPIMVAGKVAGALGASVFLDDLHAQLNREFALPPGYTWFVLDASGNTMLDQDSAFIFRNALSDGSPALREAVAAALRQDSGIMQYDYAGTLRRAQFQILPHLPWRLILAHSENDDVQVPPPLRLTLEHFVPALQHSLQQIDTTMAQLARSSVEVSDDVAMRRLLAAVVDSSPAVVNAAFVDAAGVLRQIEPRDYRNFENVDISSQAHVQALRRKPVPVFSAGFTSVEGFLAVDVAHPLYDRSGKLVGSLSALLRPELLIAPLLENSTIPASHELWIMQPDGMIIYDQDADEIGRLLFSDAAYADFSSLLKLGRSIAAAPTGTGSYFFVAPQSREKVIKKAVWQTIRLHGREWRVVLAYRPYDGQ